MRQIDQVTVKIKLRHTYTASCASYSFRHDLEFFNLYSLVKSPREK